jgi:uncharacterized protein (TIGR03437 family)
MRPFEVCALLALAAALSGQAQNECRPQAPCYSAAGIVNAASNQPGLASATWVSLYGDGLAYQTRDRTGADELPGMGGVNVYVNGLPTWVSYVSPLQVNFLLPSGLTVPQATIQLAREGTVGPAIEVLLDDSAPALFQLDRATVVAAHTDWTVVTPESPARAGQYVILYATGLGPFLFRLDDYEIPETANPILRRPEMRLLLDGEAVDDVLLEYVGTAPGFIGVYQINLKLPDRIGPNPEVRIALGDRISPPGLRLPAE